MYEYRKIFAVLAVLLVLGLTAQAKPRWQAGQHKSGANIYRVDLSGSQPSAAELLANGIVSGDIVMDVSNDDQYVVLETTGPVYHKTSAAGAVTIDGALTAGSIVGPTSGDGSAVTNLNGANIASGDIASDRMTANAVVVTDFTQNAGVLVGTGPGTFAEETGTTLLMSIGCQSGTGTNGQEITFSPTYAATPAIILTYAEDPGNSTSVNVSAWTSSAGGTNFTINGVAAKNIDWHAYPKTQ